MWFVGKSFYFNSKQYSNSVPDIPKSLWSADQNQKVADIHEVLALKELGFSLIEFFSNRFGDIIVHVGSIVENYQVHSPTLPL